MKTKWIKWQELYKSLKIYNQGCVNESAFMRNCIHGQEYFHKLVHVTSHMFSWHTFSTCINYQTQCHFNKLWTLDCGTGSPNTSLVWNWGASVKIMHHLGILRMNDLCPERLLFMTHHTENITCLNVCLFSFEDYMYSRWAPHLNAGRHNIGHVHKVLQELILSVLGELYITSHITTYWHLPNFTI